MYTEYRVDTETIDNEIGLERVDTLTSTLKTYTLLETSYEKEERVIRKEKED